MPQGRPSLISGRSPSADSSAALAKNTPMRDYSQHNVTSHVALQHGHKGIGHPNSATPPERACLGGATKTAAGPGYLGSVYIFSCFVFVFLSLGPVHSLFIPSYRRPPNLAYISRAMSKTQSLTVQTSIPNITLTVVHSPDMPSASKISHRPYSWPEVEQIVATNDLDAFSRSGETTEKYLAFKRKLRQEKISNYKYLLIHPLGWANAQDVAGLPDADIKIASSGNPIFTDSRDLKIVRNDFPYFFEDNVEHLCVWSKEPITADPNSEYGDISPQTRATIEKYIQQTFVEKAGIPRKDLLWFKNWEALQSIREISHVHVLVRGASKAQIDGLVGTPGIPLKL